MNPPLRAESDRKALVEALRSGLVDCVATDHAPHVSEEKDVPYEEAPFGVHRPRDGLQRALRGARRDRRARPRHAGHAHERRAGADRRPGRADASPPAPPADLCVVDPAAVWTVTPDALQSRSWNSPWLGQELTGKVRLTVAAGRVAWDDLA